MLEFLWFSLRSQGLSSPQQGPPPLISHFFLSFFLVLFSRLGLGLLPADNDKGHTCRINDWSALPPPASPGSLFEHKALSFRHFSRKETLSSGGFALQSL